MVRVPGKEQVECWIPKLLIYYLLGCDTKKEENLCFRPAPLLLPTFLHISPFSAILLGFSNQEARRKEEEGGGWKYVAHGQGGRNRGMGWKRCVWAYTVAWCHYIY